MTDQDFGGFSIPSSGGSTPITVIPTSAHQETLGVNLAPGASIDFDFNVTNNPILDMFIRTDGATVIVQVFARQSTTDVFGQVGIDIAVTSFDPNGFAPLGMYRAVAAQVRVRIKNNGAVPTTVLSAQVFARSI